MWNPKAELAKAAHKVAANKHPRGYTKSQLVECGTEVNGGFSANPSKPIRTLEDVAHMANHMANIDGRYPVGMSDCHVVGINGGCGIECPVYLAGKCECADEMEAE